MGLFSSKKKVYVASVAYNLAGPIEDRPNFLRSVVLQGVLGQSDSLGADIVGQHLNGPGIDQRSFYRWSKTNYPLGSMQAQIFQSNPVDTTIVAAEIPISTGESVTVQTAFIDTADIVYWAEAWLLANDPTKFDLAWVVDFDESTMEMVISFPADPEVRVAMPGFQRTRKHVFAYYTLTLVDTTQEKRVFIYAIGSGNPDLDALEESVREIPEIFPVIPLRIDNRPINDPLYATDFPSHKKAYKKAMGSKIEDILKSIEENEDIGDIDHAFLVHGVEMNTVEPLGRRYIFEFLKSVVQDQKTTPTDLGNWISYMLGYETALTAYAAWQAAQLDPLDPLYGTPEPTVPAHTTIELTRCEMRTSSTMPYEAHIGWVTIDEEVFSGLGRPGAQVGEVWFQTLSDLDIPGVPFVVVEPDGSVARGTLTRFRAYRQESATTFRRLTVYGMYHENFVYGGKSVYIEAPEALDDPDETGFIFPLHYPSLLGMSLIDSTQLAMSNKLVVFNCYKVVKQRWYQRGIFRFLFAIVLTVVVFPAGAGLLGTNIALGAALGFSGVGALIIGAIANSLAAIVLMSVIEKGAVDLFGEELGAIIGVIASFLTMQYASSFFGGTGITLNFGTMFRAENLLKLTDLASNIIAKYAEVKIGDYQEQYQDALDQYNLESRDIRNRSLELLGSGGAFFNPLFFLQGDDNGYLGMPGATDPTLGIPEAESPSTFLKRALLTGSDIAEISLSVIGAFPQLCLEPPKLIA
ncbi:MAG: hypothetical protein ACT4OK_10985 [Gemmobacter sp.]